MGSELLSVGVFTFLVAFIRQRGFRQFCLQLGGGALCLWVAYFFLSTDRPFEVVSNKVHALSERLEAKRDELQANLAAAEKRRATLETVSEKIDWSKPIYTRDRAIICPLSIFNDPRADHDVDAIRNLWTSFWNRGDKVKALGCEEWREGVLVMARIAFPDRESSIVIINGNLFTQQSDLRN